MNTNRPSASPSELRKVFCPKCGEYLTNGCTLEKCKYENNGFPVKTAAAPSESRQESRERAQKLIGDFVSQNEVLACDWLANVLQQAERDTRERDAQLISDQDIDEVMRYPGTLADFFQALAERIRGKGAQ